MQDWINGSAAVLKGLWEFAQSNPLLFGSIMSVGLGLVWFKWWIIGKSQRQALDGLTAGWSREAQSRAVPHETGIGTQEILVMKPANKPLRTGILCTLLFGGFAYFGFTRIHLAEATIRDWSAFVITLAFSLMGLLVMAMAFTRIVVKGDRLQHKRLFRRGATYSLRNITKVEPVAGSIIKGVNLTFDDGRRLRIRAVLSGYKMFLARLAKQDPKIELLLRMIERPNARTARS